jgi:tetratricopeptide (TPR) repeat protein
MTLNRLQSRHRQIFEWISILAVVFALLCTAPAAFGRADDSIAALKHQAEELVKAEKFTEALPILEKIVAAEPNDAHTQFNLAFALIGQAIVTKDLAERKAMRIRARNSFLKAKELGETAPVLVALIEGLPADGSDTNTFSTNTQVNDLMNGAEALFAQGKLDEALLGYQRALELDPKMYHAALFSGDVFTQKGDFPSAEIWYQKAIAIDPNKETAYRYSATPFMKQQKYDVARDRYVEAYIAEPYNKFSAAGLNQWSQVTKTSIGHPKIDIPVEVTVEDKGDTKINITADAMMNKDGGGAGWILYGGTRTQWHKEKFAKAFPDEKVYRHSLAEEAEALRAVISISTTSDAKLKNLSPALLKLKKLNDEGLLESYILLARADEGIAEDYPAYRDKNRDKLRRYVVDYVLTAGGK